MTFLRKTRFFRVETSSVCLFCDSARDVQWNPTWNRIRFTSRFEKNSDKRASETRRIEKISWNLVSEVCAQFPIRTPATLGEKQSTERQLKRAQYWRGKILQRARVGWSSYCLRPRYFKLFSRVSATWEILLSDTNYSEIQTILTLKLSRQCILKIFFLWSRKPRTKTR